MKEQTLLDKAIDNYEIACALFELYADDEAKLNFVGCHLEQAVELFIKHTLEINGVKYKQTHDITVLMEQCQSAGLQIPGEEYIDDNSEMFTSWESKTRYIKDYYIQKRKVAKAIQNLREIIKKET